MANMFRIAASSLVAMANIFCLQSVVFSYVFPHFPLAVPCSAFLPKVRRPVVLSPLISVITQRAPTTRSRFTAMVAWSILARRPIFVQLARVVRGATSHQTATSRSQL